MLNTIVPASFQDVYKSDEVAIDIGVRVLEGLSDPGLGGKIDDPLWALCFEKVSDG